MLVRWSAPAADDLYQITTYIRQNSASAARKVARTIYDACESLATSPYRGRTGKQDGTRELVVSSLPYLVVYRIHRDAVEILHIWHGAQDR